MRLVGLPREVRIMCKRILTAVVVCIVATCCGQMAHGQATGSFLGTVTDKSGSAISGASVRVTSQGTGASREAKTDDAGHHIINSQQVSQLPLNGRDFVQLATLSPGTAAETNPNSFFTTSATSEVAARGPFSLSVGGSRP